MGKCLKLKFKTKAIFSSALSIMLFIYYKAIIIILNRVNMEGSIN